MRTAVLVLAIIGDVFGVFAVIAAFAFGSTLVGLSGGYAGSGATSGAGLAVLAVILGIGMTVVCQARPRLAGAGLATAAIVGVVGTWSYLPTTVLHLIAGTLALFAPAQPRVLQASVATVPAEHSATALHRTRPRLRLSRRQVAVVAAAVIVSGVVGSVALAVPAEQQPVRALLAAIAAGDDVALADLLAPSQRRGSATADASEALSAALGHSEIAFVTQDWLRTLGPASGTKVSFEELRLTTAPSQANDGNTVVVHVRGIFSPHNDNGVLDALVKTLRRPFDADVALTRIDGRWYVTGSSSSLGGAAVGSPPAPAVLTPRVPSGTPSTTDVPPTPRPATSAPRAPAHLVSGSYPLATPITITASGWALTLRSITIESDDSSLWRFDLLVGPQDGSWAGRESRLELASGTWLNVNPSKSTFYDGGRGSGSTVPVALAFSAGLAGNQPYVLRVCGNLGFCWPVIPGPPLPER